MQPVSTKLVALIAAVFVFMTTANAVAIPVSVVLS